MLWVTLTGAVLGCGQKGPLVLPDAQRPHKQIGFPRAPAPKPATTAPTAPAAPAGTAAPSAASAAAPSNPDGTEAKPDAAPQP